MNVKEIVILAFYLSLMTFLSFVPQTGYIKVGIFEITIIPPIVVFATYHMGFKGSLLAGLSFGIFSFIYSLTSGALIKHPLVWIVPRVLMTLIIYLLYRLLGEIKVWKFILLSFISILLNTTLVTGAIFTINQFSDIYKGTFKVFLGLIYLNFVIEMIYSILISAITFPLLKYLISKKGKSFDNSW